jgi:hypothetical protein
MACDTSERTPTELRIARAYVSLSCIPEESSETSVSLGLVGSCEIRMFRGPTADLGGSPLFWLELFDRSTKTSVDGVSCRTIKDAVSVVDDFILQAGRLNKPEATQ